MTQKRTNWLNAAVIILSFLLVFLPAQVASPAIQKIMVFVFGGLSILIQLMQFKSGAQKGQRIILFTLTVAAIVLMFLVYSKS